MPSSKLVTKHLPSTGTKQMTGPSSPQVLPKIRSKCDVNKKDVKEILVLYRASTTARYTRELRQVLNIGVVEDNWIPTLLHNAFLKVRESPVEGPRDQPRRDCSNKKDTKAK